LGRTLWRSIAEQLRAKRKGKVGKIWFVDETYVRVKGKWCYLYQALMMNLVDVRLSKNEISKQRKPSLLKPMS